MNGLIARLEERDPEMQGVLALTSECERTEEVDQLLAALASSRSTTTTTASSISISSSSSDPLIHSVVFRESFFPRRQILWHLHSSDFLRLLDGIAPYASHTVRIPPTMTGILRGQLASHTIGPLVQYYYADEAITFCDQGKDVQTMGDRLAACTQLKILQLGDCFLYRSNQPCLDALLQVSPSVSATLQQFELSTHAEQRIKQPLLGGEALRHILSSCPQLHLLNLSRLGLLDEQFTAIADALASHAPSSLRQLCLDGNRPTRAGLQSLADALQSASLPLVSVSLQETWHTDQVDWSRIFPANVALEELEIDMTTGIMSYDGRRMRSVEFWLDLNAHGRRRHLIQYGQQLPSNLWPLLLEGLQSNPSGLWYLLRAFPDQMLLRATMTRQ